MIESCIDRAKGQGYIVVCPNMSAQWGMVKRFLWFISTFVFIIASVFSFFGMWMILPFAGLEVMALISVSYWVAYQCCRKEVIRINENKITVEKGYHVPLFTWQSELFWTRLVIDPPAFKGHPLKLFLRSRQNRLEIGGFLNDDDKQKLIAELRGVVHITN